MAIFKVHKTSDFTVVSTHHLREKDLSLKAKGLLTLMLSLPDGWDYSVMGLAALSKDGKDSVMTTLDELESFGYLEIDTQRNDKGQFDSVYNVFENPNRKTRCGKSESDNPTQYNIEIKNENNIPLNTTLFGDESPLKDSISPKGKNIRLDLSFIDDAYMGIMQTWLKYKREKRQTYTQTGLQTCYKKLLTLSGRDPKVAEQIVENSMANNYSGLFPLRDKPQVQQQEENHVWKC